MTPPPLSNSNLKFCVKSWLLKHRCAEDTRSEVEKNKIDKIENNVVKDSLWKILEIINFLNLFLNIMCNINIIFNLLFFFEKKVLFFFS